MVDWGDDRAAVPLLVVVAAYFGSVVVRSRDALAAGSWGLRIAFGLWALNLGMAIWVYLDAKRRDLDDPLRWIVAVLVPVVGAFGLAAYLWARD